MSLLQRNKIFFSGALLYALLVGTSHVHGQITGMVFGPNVIAKETVVDFRIGYDADEPKKMSRQRFCFRNHE